jgi:hypothetical protein
LSHLLLLTKQVMLHLRRGAAILKDVKYVVAGNTRVGQVWLE